MVFIAWCNENKMSSLDMDSQLLLGCEPQGQKQNLAPAGLSLKAWALNGHLLVYVSVFLVTWCCMCLAASLTETVFMSAVWWSWSWDPLRHPEWGIPPHSRSCERTQGFKCTQFWPHYWKQRWEKNGQEKPQYFSFTRQREARLLKTTGLGGAGSEWYFSSAKRQSVYSPGRLALCIPPPLFLHFLGDKQTSLIVKGWDLEEAPLTTFVLIV